MPMGGNNLPGPFRLLQRFPLGWASLLIIPGNILIALAVAYYIYAAQAGAGLDDLNVKQEPTPAFSPAAQVPDAATATRTPPTNTIAPTAEQPTSAGTRPALLSDETIASQQAYPGELISPYAWEDPTKYDPLTSEGEKPLGYDPVLSSQGSPAGSLAGPERIIITSIGVDSEVKGLEILDLGDSRAYETPNNVVGHIPQGGNPGEVGSSWYFGHLESPVAGEGNVFRDLPGIPDMLRRGDEVYAEVFSSSGAYLYQITESLVLEANDLSLSYADIQEANPDYAGLDPGGAILHLVTCVPRLVYDHRLVVSGQLVGVRGS